MTPTWAELHEMEPGLRPRPDDEGPRDRACEWLNEHPPLIEVIPWYRADLTIERYDLTRFNSDMGTRDYIDDFPTRDEALRAACAAVIGAGKEEAGG